MGPLVGAVTIDDAYVVATSQEFLLSSHDLNWSNVTLRMRQALAATRYQWRSHHRGDQDNSIRSIRAHGLTARSDLTMPSIPWAQPQHRVMNKPNRLARSARPGNQLGARVTRLSQWSNSADSRPLYRGPYGAMPLVHVLHGHLHVGAQALTQERNYLAPQRCDRALFG